MHFLLVIDFPVVNFIIDNLGLEKQNSNELYSYVHVILMWFCTSLWIKATISKNVYGIQLYKHVQGNIHTHLKEGQRKFQGEGGGVQKPKIWKETMKLTCLNRNF